MDLARINVNVGGIPQPGYQGDESRFQELAALVGKPLPLSYIQFLRMHDGGHPEASSFFRPGEEDYDHSLSVDNFYSLSDGAQCIFKEFKVWKETLGEGMLPIARDGGDSQIYLNFNESVPSVWMWLHDAHEPEENGESDARFKIADSFGEFIDGLTINPDYDEDEDEEI